MIVISDLPHARQFVELLGFSAAKCTIERKNGNERNEKERNWKEMKQFERNLMERTNAKAWKAKAETKGF